MSKYERRAVPSRGIGWAFNEEYFVSDDGRMMYSSFLDYRVPTALHVPMIETFMVEVPNPGHASVSAALAKPT